MTGKRHGLSIGVERHGAYSLLVLRAVGHLTHADYEQIAPVIEGALSGVKEPRLRALVEATEFEGWEPRALWDDFRLGLRHGAVFDRIAIWGDKRWQEVAAKIGSWFISGEARFFESRDEALRWLAE
ncbi:STAS/SEC14 domain-containing protein [Guyparkeria hydrothermalis]|uniref:STAS/SEC14 domain-containing protein n=1 Tax=Guyparkeria hydrothermalis TaxID=923 RepID=UPI0020221FE4|nr:STAS/SEC14 domain-containing protein [Guyparkeria hydrothermalis]MCL7743559.1 STAS/SEC14 domain-containing protein [Guyparkeria hydrothermalis]